MSNFRERIAIIPPTAKVLAGLLGVGMLVLIAFVAQLPPSHNEQPLPPAAKVLLPILCGVLIYAWVMLVGFVYGDAKQRGMRYVMWTWLAVLLPDAIGIILYFILRDALPVTCPTCSTRVNSKFPFCPNCGTALKPRCPQCGQSVELAWANCGQCGTKLPAPGARTA